MHAISLSIPDKRDRLAKFVNKQILVGKMDFVGCDWERFVSTRWLSLEICCDKELKKCEALKNLNVSQ